ncbi:MAG: TonB-dependent receptor [Planctomycetales bacterium]|nr:TonB-dependent receptor [Planctomycetales bacterium]
MTISRFAILWSLSFACASIQSGRPAYGQDEGPLVLPETTVEATPPAFNPTPGAGTVFGDAQGAFESVGSADFLGTEAIRAQSYDDVNRVLRKAPGVYLREEDGFGNFPNISLRGVDTTRSAKVTIMEDGILAAPAPYAAPSAYYFPTVGRMSSVEIFKGASQVPYGPHITGGVINFNSTLIPDDPTAYLRMLYGTNNEMRIHTYFGGSYEASLGRWGFLLEGYFRETDGFKHIDQTPDFRSPDSRDTGFSKREPMLKLFWEPGTEIYQRWEVKTGYSDFKANETYLGLSESDFRSDPYRRYAASRFDNIDTQHNRNYVRYTLGDSQCDCLSTTFTAYYNTFERNWFKLNDLRAVDSNGDGTPDAGNNTSLSAALAGSLNGDALDVLRGERAGVLRVRNNNRDYYSYGYDMVSRLFIEGRAADHEIQGGIRYHTDRVRRFQRDELFTQATNGTITDRDSGTPGDAGNRRQETNAIAFYVQDAIQRDRLTVTPGVRFEHLNLIHDDFDVPARTGTDQLDLTAGGVGITYQLSDQLLALGSFHRGFSPPSPRAAVVDGFQEEESLASELGVRYSNPNRAFGMTLIGFYTHFNDLLVLDHVGGAGTGETEQVGEVFSEGLEFAVQYDLGQDRGWCVSNPWFLTATYTNARQLTDSVSADAESIFAGGARGARIPYIPEWALSMGTGLHFERLGFDLTGNYIESMFTTASNTDAQINPVSNEPDARFGRTDDYFIWDISFWGKLTHNWEVFGGLQNIFDEQYIVSRHPHGPRPGAPFFGYVGLQATY